jgi:DNA replication protein DnaC
LQGGASDAAADAILDRLAHNAYRIELNGQSMRKAAAKKGKLS